MTGLVEWTNHALETGEQHPLVVIAIFIVSFLAIHPFQDGNGRLFPCPDDTASAQERLCLRSVRVAGKRCGEHEGTLLHGLANTQGTIRTAAPDWAPWLEYFLGALSEQKSRLERKIEREQLLLGDLPELSVKILELCKERGQVTISEIGKVTGANRNTIKDHVAALTRHKHLTRHGAGRGAWYGLI